MNTPPVSPKANKSQKHKRSGSTKVIRRIRSFADLQVKRSPSGGRSVNSQDKSPSPVSPSDSPMSLSWSFVVRDPKENDSVELLPFPSKSSQNPTFHFVPTPNLTFDSLSLADREYLQSQPPFLTQIMTPDVGPASPKEDMPLELEFSAVNTREQKLQLKPSLLFKRFKFKRSQSESAIQINTKTDSCVDSVTRRRYSDSYSTCPAMFFGPITAQNRKFSTASAQTQSSVSVSDITVLSSVSDESFIAEQMRGLDIQTNVNTAETKRKFVSFKDPPDLLFQYNANKPFYEKNRRGKRHKVKKMLASLRSNLLAPFQQQRFPEAQLKPSKELGNCRSHHNIFTNKHRVAPVMVYGDALAVATGASDDSNETLRTGNVLPHGLRPTKRQSHEIAGIGRPEVRRNSAPAVNISRLGAVQYSSHSESGSHFQVSASSSTPASTGTGPAGGGYSENLDNSKTNSGITVALGWAFDSFWSWMGYPGEEEFMLDRPNSEQQLQFHPPDSKKHPRSKSEPVESGVSKTELITPLSNLPSPDGSKLLIEQFESFSSTRDLISPSRNATPPPLHLIARKDASVDGLLLEPMAYALRPHLPANQRECSQWKLVYSLEQHGVSLNTLYSYVKSVKCGLLLAIKDTGGSVFGAYLSDALRPSTGYYGTGECFLWKASGSGLETLSVYHATGANDYLIHSEVNFIAMGGGEGHFGLWLDRDLLNGHSSYCPTFDNPCLSTKAEFQCQSLELWTFIL